MGRRVEHKVIDSKGHKYCSKCKGWKPLSEFARSSKNWDGLQNRCKSCNRAWRLEHPNHMKSWYRKNKKQQHKNTTNRTKKLTKQGLCVVCRKPRITYSKCYCFTCWLKQKAYDATGRRSDWKYLRDLLEEQNWRCALTGEILVAGQNASVDHIKPRSVYPELVDDVTNLQWTTHAANSSKKSKTNSEYRKWLENKEG